ncbi:MAG TPA: hypothetical protein VII58_08060 [Acidobacteriaceae bacterium]
MTTVQISLPDELAQEAERAGVLSPELLERWVREQLQVRRGGRLIAAMDRIQAGDDPEAMSPEEVATEIAAMRAERRDRLAR